MKRAPFLGATGAALLTAPGSHEFMRTLAGLGPSTFYRAPRARAKPELVPAVPDPIPPRVLANPILGEAFRFAGATAPRGWMFARGELLPIATNRDLFSIFRNLFGGDGRTTFALPNAAFPVIVAVSGLFPSSPLVLARAGRNRNPAASLGPGAMPARPRRAAPVAPAVLAARKLAAAQPRFATVAPVPLAPPLLERIASAKKDARAQVLAALGAPARARFDAALGDALAGRTNLYGIVRRTAAGLSAAETRSLLAIGDSFTRAFNPLAPATIHAEPALEAAHFLVSVALEPAQVRAIARRDR
jgi:hypothetical protein